MVSLTRMNTDAVNRGGAARSSVEAVVIAVERRGCVIGLSTCINSVERMSVR